jgi:hypothetical protein
MPRGLATPTVDRLLHHAHVIPTDIGCCPSVGNSRVRRWGGQLAAGGEILVAIDTGGRGCAAEPIVV